MSKALVGKHGILGAVMQFAETLKMFAEYGSKNEIPVFDSEGNIKEYVGVGMIADNIVKTLTTFADTLSDKLEKGESKDASKALKKYEGMISQLSKLSSSLDGFQRLTMSVKDLAEGIGDLGVAINDLDVDKLSRITGNIVDGTIQLNTAPRMTTSIPAGAGPVTATSRVAKTKEPDWETIAAQIGDSVGAQIVAAMKSGQMKFEFSGAGDNRGIIEFG
jgi:hypothetical protein